MPKLPRRAALRIDMPFEDAVRHILKAGPMPKSEAKPNGKKAPKVRPKVTT